MPLFKNLSARRSIGHKRQSSPTNLNDVLAFISQATANQLRAIEIARQNEISSRFGKEFRYGK